MIRYAVIRDDQTIVESATGSSLFSEHDAKAQARLVAKSGKKCSVFKEILRVEPSEPSEIEAR